jgi:hypothetical protein
MAYTHRHILAQMPINMDLMVISYCKEITFGQNMSVNQKVVMRIRRARRRSGP